MAPPKAGVPPTPKKADEAKVRRVSQIGRLLVGELSGVGTDGAVIDIGQAWKGFIPAPMFAWHPRDEGAGEASTSGREGGGGGNVPRKGSEEEVLRKGFSEEVARTREELERTLYGVKLKVSAGHVGGSPECCLDFREKSWLGVSLCWSMAGQSGARVVLPLWTADDWLRGLMVFVLEMRRCISIKAEDV